MKFNRNNPDDYCTKSAHVNPTGGVSILVVDDDPGITHVLHEFLQDQGFKVSCECDGRSALEHIEEHPPDMVLVDMKMPKMDGVTLLKNIRRRWRDIYVIMMSATERPSDGTIPFIAKPFDLDDLDNLIHQTLQPH